MFQELHKAKSIEELKRVYKSLAKKHHPDLGGEEEDFKKLNSLYQELLSKNQFDFNIDLEIENVISEILHFDLLIEIVGSWIWISGDTKAIKETLKNLGFKWASKKMMWYYGELLKCSSRKEKSIEEIRATYGSQKVQTKKSERIAA